jgi:trehalose 6-phosphate phosphatase
LFVGKDSESDVLPSDPVDFHNTAFLLDVDGTLLDLAPTPQSVVAPARLKRALRSLSDRTEGAVAFVSGRVLRNLDALFAPLKLAAVAGHGAELRASPGDEPTRYDAPVGGSLRDQFAAVAAKLEGVLFEDKGYSLALHFRLAPEHAVTVREAVAAACAPYPASAIEVLPGKAVIEVKSSAFSKGTGICELMMVPPFRGRRPIFIGDDVTDESAFAVLPRFKGLGYSVGRRFKGAAGTFPAPGDVREWLYGLAEDASSRPENPVPATEPKVRKIVS